VNIISISISTLSLIMVIILLVNMKKNGYNTTGPTGPTEYESKSYEGFGVRKLVYVDVSGNLLADTMTNLQSTLLPTGMIMMWNSPNPPEGWGMCNGEGGKPDFRNRFPVGAGGNYTYGEKGGADTVTLTVAEIPAHSHGQKLCDMNDNNGTKYPAGGDDNRGCGGFIEDAKYIESTGGGDEHENRPPYLAVYYIIKL
jgi:hypothetical protein